ncbi:hypothetical protein [Sphingomonas melonis]|uniref:hypothetical protein n=1 Tax=Sphingomonas melonis TaxID=152682 RepID=UPI0035C82BF3
MSLPKTTRDTIQGPGGAWHYRIFLDGVLRLTSGGFQLQHDADRCGRYVSADVPALIDFLKDKA